MQTKSPKQCTIEVLLLNSKYDAITYMMATSGHKVPKKGYTGRRNMELNAHGINESSDVPTYIIQHPIHIDTYMILVDK